ncbi:hypothetical protein B0T13DRAFT_470169 [Neurospora crassa]|nr:hypothetical protein B0T13DRAFT_484321 [Neurospora crassa]KAK3498641.1 hypothetical protein B0T13DRAFT_470169 [Neurospora crassa]
MSVSMLAPQHFARILPMYLAGTVSFLLSALMLIPVPMSFRPSRPQARMSCRFGCSAASSLSPAAIFSREGLGTLDEIPGHYLPMPCL